MNPTFSIVVNQKNRRGAAGLRQKLDKTRQMDLITAISAEAATERQILNRVGDTRYTRELLRKLISMDIVERTGKGGLHDPFLYKLSPFLGAFDFSSVQDPILERRMKRIEGKILDLLSDNDRMVARSERCIRTVIGDNTGTGKALRRLVKSSKVKRIGKGGAGSPFMYRLGDALLLPPSSPAPCSSGSIDADDGCPPSPAHQPPALSPAAIFEEMAALMAPCPPGAPRFRGAGPCGASLGGGDADDSADDDGGAGGEGAVLGPSASSSSRGRDADPR